MTDVGPSEVLAGAPADVSAGWHVPPWRTLGRRYYPVGIGIAVLSLTVGLFPSLVPTSSLGLIPRLASSSPNVALPARVNPATPPAAGFAAAPLPPYSGVPAPITAAATAPAPSQPAPVTSPSTSSPSTGSGAVGSGQSDTCPLSVLAEPPAPPAADLIEAFAAAGPLGPEATAGAPALAPVIPVVAPLFPLAGGVAGGKGGDLISTALVDLANLEDAVFAPFSSEINAFTPTAVADDEKFYREIGPLLTLASNVPELQCVGDLEIATGATVVPSDYPAATPLTGLGHSATAASPDQRVVTVSDSWASGLTPSFARSVEALIAQGLPVEVRLVDDAPASQANDTSGFASWVSATMASLPKVSVWEIDPSQAAPASAGSVAPADPAASLAAALTAAAEARAPGQLLGLGYPVRGSSWWPQLKTDINPAVFGVLNFVGVDASTLGAVAPDGLRWVVTLLRRGTLAQGGFSSGIPLFVTAGTAGTASDAEQIALAGQDAAALSGLGVGLLTWSSPSTELGQLFSAPGAAAQSLLSALRR
jgi:hypothetical protein